MLFGSEANQIVSTLAVRIAGIVQKEPDAAWVKLVLSDHDCIWNKNLDSFCTQFRLMIVLHFAGDAAGQHSAGLICRLRNARHEQIAATAKASQRWYSLKDLKDWRVDLILLGWCIYISPTAELRFLKVVHGGIYSLKSYVFPSRGSLWKVCGRVCLRKGWSFKWGFRKVPKFQVKVPRGSEVPSRFRKVYTESPSKGSK